MESLLLFRRALSSPTMCRFIPALSVPELSRVISPSPSYLPSYLVGIVITPSVPEKGRVLILERKVQNSGLFRLSRIVVPHRSAVQPV